MLRCYVSCLKKKHKSIIALGFPFVCMSFTIRILIPFSFLCERFGIDRFRLSFFSILTMTTYRRRNYRLLSSIMTSIKDEKSNVEEAISEFLPLSGPIRGTEEVLSTTAHFDHAKDSTFEIHPRIDEDFNVCNQFNAFEGLDNEPIPLWCSFLPKPVVDFFFPPNVPRCVQLFRKENIAIPLCYLFVGLVSLSKKNAHT